MRTDDFTKTLTRIFSELVNGTHPKGGFVLNPGDIGLLRSLEKLSAADASRSANDGATIAAHTEHLRYGLSLMNEWAANGGNPFANAQWDLAWKTSTVDAGQWQTIRDGLRRETERWQHALSQPRDVADIELMGIVGSVAHIAYHLGAIRQINKDTRGPKQTRRSDSLRSGTARKATETRRHRGREAGARGRPSAAASPAKREK